MDTKSKQSLETEQLITLFKDKGLTVMIDGCGCCASPWVKIDYKGTTVFDHDDVTIDMFKAEDK